MRVLAFVLIIFLSLASQALELGFAGGYRSMQSDTDLQNASVSSRSGFQVGPLAYLPLNDIWGVRTGFLYTQRFVTIENTGQGDVDIDYAYFDVPGTVMIRIGDFAGAFAGPVLSFNQSKDVVCTANSACSASDVKSIVIPWQVGLSFRFFSQLGGELYYEYLPGDISKNVSNMRSVGANLILYFE